MDTTINTFIDITLRPVYHSGTDAPEVTIHWGKQLLWQGVLTETISRTFEVEGNWGYEYNFGVTLLNKKPGDTVVEDKKIVADKGVYIDKITVEGFNFDSIMHEIRCTDWARYSDGSPAATIDPLFGNYVCWNERWDLPIRLPAFTWLHKLEKLGWIYDDTI